MSEGDGMLIKRDSLTREQVDEILEMASPVIEFGNTRMGILEYEEIGSVAIGRRKMPRTKPDLFHILELLGPISVDDVLDVREASYMLESLLNKAENMGVSGRVAAIVADSKTVFGLFAEGLIVDNYFDPVINNLAEGRVILNGRIYRLLAFSGSGVLGLGNNAVLVDTSLVPVP